MKKCLYALLVVQILALAIGFFLLLGQNWVYSLVFLGLGVLNLVPIIAIISCLDTTEQNSGDISYIYYKLKQMENESPSAVKTEAPAVKRNDSPKKPWKCIKCGTVNKAEDNICAGCNAEFDYLNPTYDSEPKRKSRFVKFK